MTKLKVKIDKELYKILKEDSDTMDCSMRETVELFLWAGIEHIMEECENMDNGKIKHE